MKTRMTAALLALAAAGPAAADEWTYSITPYVWATDVGIDLALRDRSLVDETIPFEDLLKDLESGALLRAQAMRGAHGIAIDLFDVSLADASTVPLPGGSGGELALDAEIGMTILDVTGVYDRDGDGRGFALLYGARVLGQREDIEAQTAGDAADAARYESDERFVDALLGLRYAGAFSDRWSYEVTADVSTGGTQLTWSLAPSVSYAFGDSRQYSLTAGYRHFEVDFETEPTTDLDMTMTGLLVGFRFDF